MRRQKTDAQYLDNHIVLENGCHAFLGDSGPILHRRPRTRTNGKNISIARKIYEIVYGRIPSGMLIRHKCDNEYCVNSLHLVAGTHSENSQDMVDRNRQCSGSRNRFSKLTEQDVVSVRQDWIPRINPISALAKKYNVSKSTIDRALHGRGWQHVAGKRYELRGEECARGHKLTGDNRYDRPDGRIECKQCRKDYLKNNKSKLTSKRKELHRSSQVKGIDQNDLFICGCGATFKSKRSLTLHKKWEAKQLIESETQDD